VVDVRPFRGLRYNPGKIGDLTSVITPPYDVISPDQQRAYYERDPHNIIRLEFGEEFPEDSPQSNKYTRAAGTLNDWLRDGILVREGSPAFYLTEHRFPHHGGYRSYLGLVAAVRLEEFGTGRIRPTEVTMNTPAADRLNLLKSCRANLSPIMGIFDQKNNDLQSIFKKTISNKPSATAIDNDGVTFNLWVQKDEDFLDSVSRFFADKIIYIADGHHRYRTALAYREEQLAANPNIGLDEACNFIMMTLISSTDPGLSLRATHRLVRGIQPEQLAKLRGKLSDHFQIQRLAPSSSDSGKNPGRWMKALGEAGTRGTAFGIYGLEPGSCCLLTPRNISALQDSLPKDKPAAWRNLDVSLLHSVILQGMLGIDSTEKEKESLTYSPEEAKVLREVDAGKAQIAFLLNPVPISSVIAVADAGVRMPPKSTYFYPKTAAGLAIYPLF